MCRRRMCWQCTSSPLAAFWGYETIVAGRRIAQYHGSELPPRIEGSIVALAVGKGQNPVGIAT
jgi:hypothetical protein